MGSDYAVGDPDPIGSVKAAANIGEAEFQLVTGGTGPSRISDGGM